MTKTVFAAIVTLGVHLQVHAADARKESIHLAPIGTIVSGSFSLQGKIVPVPEGNYIYIGSAERDATYQSGDWLRPRTRLVSVMLVQAGEKIVRSVVTATTVLKFSTQPTLWTDEPCKRTDTLFRLDKARRSTEYNCLLVNHVVQVMAKPTGIYELGAAWLRDRGVALPVPVTVNATVTRSWHDYLVVTYAFNPAAFGGEAPSASTWALSAWHKKVIARDSEKMRFVDAITTWGKFAQDRIDETFNENPQTAFNNGTGPMPNCTRPTRAL